MKGYRIPSWFRSKVSLKQKQVKAHCCGIRKLRKRQQQS